MRRKTPLYWYFYGANGNHKVAIRTGDWKLSPELDADPIRQRGGIDSMDQQVIKTAKLSRMDLYNLAEDISETTDLKECYPDRFAEMRVLLESKYREVQAESPTWPEWESVRYGSQRIQWPAYRGARGVQARTPAIPADYHDNPSLLGID